MLRLDGDRAFIGSRELRLSLYSPPMKDGTSALIETTSDLANQYQQKLAVAELKGVLGAMLPSGFELSIYGPHSRMPGVDFLSFQNLSRGRCIRLSVHISFSDWAYRTNLIHFAENFRATIEQQLPGCQSASVAKDKYGITIWIQVLLEETDDCSGIFQTTDKQLNSIYKNALGKADSSFVAKISTHTQSADAGFRWWIRYVIVPLVSGGAGVALVGWILARV